MILIQNHQAAVSVDLKKLKSDTQKILKASKLSRFDISIILTDNLTIQAYNHDYRQQNKPTDILSFPYHPDLKPGEKIKINTPEDRNLGDLILAPQYILDDLPRWDQNFEARLEVLLVHGICHLLGYDHIVDADYEIMKLEEARLLAVLQN